MVMFNDYDTGGRRVNWQLVAGLRREGFQVRLAYVETMTAAGRGPADGAVTGLYASPRPFRRRDVPVIVWRLRKLAKACDLVVSGDEVGHGLTLSYLVARSAARPLGVIVHSHLSKTLARQVSPRWRAANAWIVQQARFVLCTSAGVRDDVVALGAPAEATGVGFVGVDLGRLRIEATAQPHPPLPAPPYVATVGRLDPIKGFDTLIRAHARAVQRLPHRLMILGGGPLEAELRQLTVELGVESSVLLAGHVANPHPHVAAANLFVLSSRSEANGSLALLEALAHGTPVVSTDCQFGPRDVLLEGRLGKLVPVDDIDALAAAITQHLEDPDELRDRAAGGPQRAAEFDADGFARALAELIRRRS